MWGLIHTTVVLITLILFFGIDLSNADFLSAGALMLIGSLSIIGIGMMAAALPLLWVERGDQMVFVIQSLLLLDQRRVLQRHHPARADAGHRGRSRRRPTSSTAFDLRLIDGAPITAIGGHLAVLGVMAVVFIPLGVWVFGWAERYAKRTGKLKRVG